MTQTQVTQKGGDAPKVAANECGDLCSQPTISRWENAPTLREIIRLTYALVDIWCRSYQKPPRSVVLDIDDTVDVVHGHQQSAQWNAHHDERCFLPIHVYDADAGSSRSCDKR